MPKTAAGIGRIFGMTLLFCIGGVLSGCEKIELSANILQTDKFFLTDEQAVAQVSRFPVNPDQNSQNHDTFASESQQEPTTFGLFANEAVAPFAVDQVQNKEQYGTVVLLAPTDYRTEEYNVFTYSNTIPLGLRPNETAINNLTRDGTVQSLGDIHEQSYWNRAMTYRVRQSFPDARFVLLSVNNNLPNPEQFARKLTQRLPENSLIIAIGEFSTNSNPNIQEFQQSFATQAITRGDQLNLQNIPASITLAVLAHIMNQNQQAYVHVRPGNSIIYSSEEEDTSQNQTSKLHLVAFGDMMLGRYVRFLMDQNGLDYPFEKMDESYLQANDILLANLEGPITNAAVRTTTGMNFGFFPDVAPLLKKYHFDLLSQANNHTLDKRDEGYNESMNFIREQGMIPFGHQRDITEDSVAFMYKNGQRLAFLGLEEVNSPINDAKALEKVKELVAQNYKVIVYPHWGIEYQNRPSQRQRDLAHSWIDAGAYAIIGHHPHVIQTYETYNGRPIFYSLGNAIFDQYWSVPTQEGLSIAMIIEDNRTIIYFLPIKIDRSQMRLMDPRETRVQLEKLVEWGDHSEAEKQSILNGKLIL